MDTKSRNKIALIAWMVLFTIGLSGVLPFLAHDYFIDGRTAYYMYIACSIVAFIISLVWLKHPMILDALDHIISPSLYKRIPIDVSTFVMLMVSFGVAANLTDEYDTLPNDILRWAKNIVICAFFIALVIYHIRFMVTLFRSADAWQQEWKRSIIAKVWTAMHESFLVQSIGIQITLILCVIFASGFGFMVVCLNHGGIALYAPLFVIVTMPTLFVLYRRIGYLNRIMHGTANMVHSATEADLPTRGASPFAKLAADVNMLRQGVRTSHAEQAKSERLKTELITNVSHDLRTPLTSIITYTELLKTPDLSVETRNEYIAILDNKSQRLKVLIDDLFEASKMASGNVDLVTERVDLTQLLQQALAENEQPMTESGLHFRVTTPENPVYCRVDGAKMWRVFDNLITNILKYTLENTRVYIALETQQDTAVVTFKNVTKYELSENIDELFERFKRGDTSRHTEGSGLGLAIAQSIVDLHGGHLDIQVDGDLFKATVTLYIAR